MSTTAVTNITEEGIWITVQCSMYPSFITSKIYRHPHPTAESFDYIEDIFRKLTTNRKPFFFIILGDLNDDLNESNASLAGIFKKNTLKQFINETTRIT